MKIGESIKKPEILKQPENITIVKGSVATFKVEARGTNLTYQWKKAETDISGANTNTYTMPSIDKPDNNTSYKCVVKNSAGEIVSSMATLTVHYPPVIAKQPENTKIKAGESAHFSLELEPGNPPDMTYEWKDNLGNTKSTTKECSFSSTKDDNNKTYKCIVKNQMINNTPGMVESNQATLTVHYVEITQQPQLPVNSIIGKSFSLSIQAQGNPSPQYEWKKDGSTVTGGNSATYSVSSAKEDDKGIYKCRVYNIEQCELYSKEISVVVTDQPPEIATPLPASKNVIIEGNSQTETFSFSASGTNLKYNWKYNNRPLTDVPNASIINYTFTTSAPDAILLCEVSNTSGSKSTSSRITIQYPASISAIQISPQSNIIPGTTLSLQAIASGKPQQITYTWFKNNQQYKIGNPITYSCVDNDAAQVINFICKVTNGVGNPSQMTKTVNVGLKPNKPPAWKNVPEQTAGGIAGTDFQPFNLKAYVTDPDGDEMEFSLETVQSSTIQISVTGSGDVTFPDYGTPPATSIIVFKAKDRKGATSTSNQVQYSHFN